MYIINILIANSTHKKSTSSGDQAQLGQFHHVLFSTNLQRDSNA